MTNADLCIVNCGLCGVPFGMTHAHRDLFQENKKLFYCPNGHSQSYVKSASQLEIERLKRLDLDRQKVIEGLANDEYALRKRLTLERRRTAYYKGRAVK